jgi:hypothetical protein
VSVDSSTLDVPGIQYKLSASGFNVFAKRFPIDNNARASYSSLSLIACVPWSSCSSKRVRETIANRQQFNSYSYELSLVAANVPAVYHDFLAVELWTRRCQSVHVSYPVALADGQLPLHPNCSV